MNKRMKFERAFNRLSILGKNPVESCIRNKKWNKALQLINSRRGIIELTDVKAIEGQGEVGTKENGGSRIGGANLLTYALLQTPPFDIVSALLFVNPYLSMTVDSYGMTPLHIACGCGSSCEIIELLLRYDKGVAATMVDKWRRTPLHHLTEYLCYPEYRSQVQEAYGIITDSADELSSKRDSLMAITTTIDPPNSNLSLTQYEFQDITNSIYDLLLCAPQAMFMQDLDGNVPIDVAHDCRATHQVIDYGPKVERATIICTIMREETVKFYKMERQMAEARTNQFTSCFSNGSLESVPTMEGSSVTSGSISIGLSRWKTDF